MLNQWISEWYKVFWSCFRLLRKCHWIIDCSFLTGRTVEKLWEVLAGPISKQMHFINHLKGDRPHVPVSIALRGNLPATLTLSRVYGIVYTSPGTSQGKQVIKSRVFLVCRDRNERFNDAEEEETCIILNAPGKPVWPARQCHSVFAANCPVSFNLHTGWLKSNIWAGNR